eukprot:m.116353 g.116353  ORF g.116353 m.116353 type:complete len:64 (+) comp21624_c0_seq1:1139-1330(+)
MKPRTSMAALLAMAVQVAVAVAWPWHQGHFLPATVCPLNTASSNYPRNLVVKIGSIKNGAGRV